MTFAKSVKNTMISIRPEKTCCKKALLYGNLLFFQHFERDRIVQISTNRAYIKMIISLIKAIAKIDFLPYLQGEVDKPGSPLRIYCENSEVNNKILNCFYPYKENVEENISKDSDTVIDDRNFSCDNCKNSFLRGVFLTCGNISSPVKGYHLEFVLPKNENSNSLLSFLKDCGFDGKETTRSGYTVIYFKGGNEIIDILSFTGANTSAFEVVNAQIEKDIRNTCNRMTNCDTANLQKTISSSARQIDAIEFLFKSGKLDKIPDKLKVTAQLRRKHPDISIAELARLHEPPVTKSCAGHRLSRICKLAEK